jgi:DNA repair protein RadC
MISGTYSISASRVYVIHDQPQDRPPQERLDGEGADVLSIKDLLGVVLEDTSVAATALHEYGIQFLTTLRTVSDVMDLLQLDKKEATKFLAALELGRRLYSPTYSSLLQVRGIEDIYKHYRVMATFPKEQLRILLINSRYQLVHEEILSIGSVESLHISAKDVFQSAVERRVTAVILVHNHPSGDPTPSAADYEFTEKMQAAAQVLGIELLDHVIIAENGSASCLNTP